MRIEDLLAAGPEPCVEIARGLADIEITVEGCDVWFRLPTSADLEQIESCASVEEGRDTLLQLCVLKAIQDGRDVPTADLPDSVVSALAAKMAELDPLGEITLDITCSECAQSWSVVLGVASFVLAEYANKARSVLDDVHILARAYAWPESEILGMSDRRRRRYLEMVS